MAELQFFPGEQDLERALADLGRELAYPPTPQLAVVVRQRLAEESARPSRRWRWLPVPDRGLWRCAVTNAILSQDLRRRVGSRVSLAGNYEGMHPFHKESICRLLARPDRSASGWPYREKVIAAELQAGPVGPVCFQQWRGRGKYH